MNTLSLHAHVREDVSSYLKKLSWPFSLEAPDLLCISPPCRFTPAMLLDPPEEWGEWLKLPVLEGVVGLLANADNLMGLVFLVKDPWKKKQMCINHWTNTKFGCQYYFSSMSFGGKRKRCAETRGRNSRVKKSKSIHVIFKFIIVFAGLKTQQGR